MKRWIYLILCLLIPLSFTSCHTDSTTPELRSGVYFAKGDFEEAITPYLNIDTETQEFSFGMGMILSYAEYGNYSLHGNHFVATSQSTTFVFEILNENTLILKDNGDNDSFNLPLGAEFSFAYEL